jgi:hypothetical protein
MTPKNAAKLRILRRGAQTPLDYWPQSQVGVLLWSLSASAHDWLPRETLTRL